MKHIKILALALLTCTNAASVDYTKNGDNWGDSYAGCKGGTQSPIDLKTLGPRISSKGDFFKFYQNLASRQIKWSSDKSTNYVDVNTDSGKVNPSKMLSGYFKSNFGKNIFNAPGQFHAQAFHTHSPSEHSVDGNLFDLELHTVHYVPKDVEKNGYVAAALGIIFDTTNYDKNVPAETVQIIDNFFESLMYNNRLDPTSPMINYGELIMSVDTDNRWVYKGSVTTPPCDQTVYWNVVNKVYPIKQKHLDFYKNSQLTRKQGQDIKKTGNNRRVQPETDAHMLQMLTTMDSTVSSTTASESNSDAYIGSTIVLAVITAFLLVMGVICIVRQKDQNGLESSPSKYTDSQTPVNVGPLEMEQK